MKVKTQERDEKINNSFDWPNSIVKFESIEGAID